MTRDVDLITYLPQFMREFKEIEAAFTAENPEFNLVWQALDKTLNNEFILTADEDGIERYEALLNITPSSNDLEIRRSRVLINWFHSMPFTLKALIEKLVFVYGDYFEITHNFETGYTLNITTQPEIAEMLGEIRAVLETWLPENIYYIYKARHSGKSDVGIAEITVLNLHFTHICDEADLTALPDFLADEDGNVLYDENSDILIDQ